MKRLIGMEAGFAPASHATDYRAHGALIAALPEDVPVIEADDDDEVWIELIATTKPVVGIPHEDMAELLGITLDEWLMPADDTNDHDDDDCIDWSH